MKAKPKTLIPLERTASVKIKPISINSCWQGRRFKTKKYSEWREESFYLIKKLKLKKVVGACCVQLTFHCSKNFKKCDADNMIKPSLDSLVESGVIADDRFIEKLIVDKVRDTEDFWEFSIKGIS